VIEFDEKLAIFQTKIKESLQTLIEFYQFLSQDFIQLESLSELTTRILIQREALDSNVKELFSINPQSSLLHRLTDIFLRFCDVKNRSIRILTEQCFRK
jgi:hypothetical protein